LSLNGEIDKRGHIDFDLADRKNTDFVFHIPGTFEGNTLVVEVKGKLNLEDIEKDFTTISTFVEKYRYIAGVFILYNHSLTELVEEAGPILRNFKSKLSANSLYILTIEEANSACIEYLLSDLDI
jgi:hypothetical protein